MCYQLLNRVHTLLDVSNEANTTERLNILKISRLIIHKTYAPYNLDTNNFQDWILPFLRADNLYSYYVRNSVYFG